MGGCGEAIGSLEENLLILRFRLKSNSSFNVIFYRLASSQLTHPNQHNAQGPQLIVKFSTFINHSLSGEEHFQAYILTNDLLLEMAKTRQQ